MLWLICAPLRSSACCTCRSSLIATSSNNSGGSRVTFQKALEVINDFDKMPPDEFEALAERFAKSMLDYAGRGIAAQLISRLLPAEVNACNVDKEKEHGSHNQDHHGSNCCGALAECGGLVNQTGIRH